MPNPNPSPVPSPTPLRWPHCGRDTTPEDPVGCRGIHVPGHTTCLAHLDATDRDAYLDGLASGSDIDHRGTRFTAPLLRALLDALRDAATEQVRFGDAQFQSATFEGDAGFRSVTFHGDAIFGSATFERAARFRFATFEGAAWFESAIFLGGAQFGSATFERAARFGSATFEDDVRFGSATFQGSAGFRLATFKGDAWFDSAIFHGGAQLGSATFHGGAQFGSATFNGGAGFDTTTFHGDAGFGLAAFHSDARFGSVTFHGGAYFVSATFHSEAQFGSATVHGEAQFSSATFHDSALFVSSTFRGGARFESATFERAACFVSVAFHRDAWFDQAVFDRAASLGPLVCAGRLALSGAVFSGPVDLSFAARMLECRRTRWSSTAELRLRYATVDFSHAVFEYPLTIAAEQAPFVLFDGAQLPETLLSGVSGAGVAIGSLRGVDAAHLVLADVDLTGCLFTGTVHLDQLRLEGACSFAAVPAGTHWRTGHPVRFTQRRILAEEHDWRARQPGAVVGWRATGRHGGPVGPAQLAAVYRALRKSFEDSKNEPGAADFYYGEMEMRRHDRTGTTCAERSLLHTYWMLSGYGLRASRALGWLAAAMLATMLLLMGFGLPSRDPKQEATGTVPAGGGSVTLEIGKDDPRNPTGNRFTGERFEKALNVTLNSVVFRSADQELTTAGTYIEMTSRLTEPILLGLAVLAIRNRVKR